jgi:UDP-GlcNAc:undecaprenyl-phosphate GlcNAc-1-phosphate transferase
VNAPPITPYLVVFLASALVCFVGTPVVRRVAHRVGAIAMPSDRMVHERPTPSMGGLAMYAGVLVGLLVARALPAFDGLAGSTMQWLAMVGAVTVSAGVGAIDDVKDITALSKLTGQVLAAGLLALGGLTMQYFLFPGQGVLSLSFDLQVLLTVLWVLLLVNAVNLIDGLDGLAAGMVAIAATAFFVYMYRSPGAAFGGEVSAAALVAAITAGVCVGFLPWNFHPARVFMGDSGAMLLGTLLAVSTIFGIGRNAYPPSGGDLAVIALPVFLPLLVLAIPLLDVALAIGRRVRRKRSFAHADKEHIHHRLMDIGHGYRKTVLLMYLWSGLLSAVALTVAFVDGRGVVLAVAAVALGILLATLLPGVLARRAELRGTDRPSERVPTSAESAGAPGDAGDGSRDRPREPSSPDPAP